MVDRPRSVDLTPGTRLRWWRSRFSNRSRWRAAARDVLDLMADGEAG